MVESCVDQRREGDAVIEQKTAGLLALFMCLIAAPVATQEVAAGDTVFALWEPDSAYFIGTAVEESESGFLIVFEDGDVGVVGKCRVGQGSPRGRQPCSRALERRHVLSGEHCQDRRARALHSL